jgi:pilus assembly protein CpaF
MAREPKKLNLKSKINIETVDKEEIQIKKQENLKRAPKKLNLKSKIEPKEKELFDDTFIPTPELDVEKELDRFIEKTLDKKEPELETDNKPIEEVLDKVLVETVEEMKALNEQEVQEENTDTPLDVSDDAIEHDNEAIEDTIDFSTNEEDKQYVLNELTSELEQLSEVKEDEVTILEPEPELVSSEDDSSDDDIVDNESEDIIDLPQVTADAAPVEIPEEKIEKKSSNVSLPDAETIALLKELVIQNNMAQMNAPVRRRRNATEEEMEIEVATHLNGGSTKEETDNLSTEMSEYSHGLSNDEIKTMPFAEILKVILKDEDVTDINFNGKDLFIQNNKKGRYLFSRLIESSTIENFVRDIVNTLNNQFNTENPIVDCEIVDAYSENHNKVLRLNAVHDSISPYGNTMSIRITQPSLRLNDSDERFASNAVFKLLEAIIRGNCNILISGRTGSGKTELQKFLIKNIRDAETIVLIEDTKDTNLKELYPKKNITSWITNSKIKNPINFDSLIKASLRNNPDWIIISETRGSEAYSMIKSGLSGHKIITTLHSDSAETNVDRLIHMCKEEYDLDQLLLGQMITSVFDVGVHLDYDVTDDGIVRYVCEIIEYKGYDENGVDAQKIFEVALQPVKQEDGTFKYQKVYKYGKISEELFSKLAKKKVLTPEISRFIKEEYYGKEIK